VQILCDPAQLFAPFSDLPAPDLHPKMASIRKQKSGRWRAQVRHKGVTMSDTFARRQDAQDWAVDREREIDRGETPKTRRLEGVQTFGDLVDLHIADMCEVGKAPRRSKEATLLALKRELGSVNVNDLDRERIVEFGRERMRQGAGPTTIGIDVGFIKLVVQHAAAVHGLPVKVEPIDLGRIALKRLGLVGHSRERDRRPSEDEIARLISHFEGNPRQLIPMGRIIRFAIATAMRQEEICRVTWSDLDTRTRMLTIRDRKDPRAKAGNNQRIPLLAVSGYDAVRLVEEQRSLRANDDDRIFPVNHKSVRPLPPPRQSRHRRPGPQPRVGTHMMLKGRCPRSHPTKAICCGAAALPNASRIQPDPMHDWRIHP
jgi:hypothetical protein